MVVSPEPRLATAQLPRSWGIVVAFVATLLATVSLSPSAIVYDSGGFDAPRFVSGMALQGQDSPPTGEGPWQKDGGTSTATVQTAIVATGLQAVQMIRAANNSGDTRWSVLEPLTPTAVDNVVRIDVDMRVEQSTFAPFDFGPAFGIEAYDASSAGAPTVNL